MTSWVRLVFAGGIVLILSALPLSGPIQYFMPLWPLLFILYIQYTLPKQFLLWGVVLLGLLLDALSGGVMGQHALILVLVAWLSTKYSLRFRLIAMPQQMLGILGLSMLYQSLLFMTCWFFGHTLSLPEYFFPAVMSGLSWPWLQYFGDSLFFKTVG